MADSVGSRSTMVMLPEILGSDQTDTAVHCQTDDNRQVGDCAAHGNQDRLHHVGPFNGRSQQGCIIAAAGRRAAVSVDVMTGVGTCEEKDFVFAIRRKKIE